MNATESQTRFLATLIRERVNPYAGISLDGLNKRDASNMISELLSAPRVDAPAPAEEGFYMRDGVVFRVQKSKSTGNPYAKKLITGEFGKAHWEYAPGVARAFTAEDKLTLDAARDMGHAYGVCMVCARTLTDPKSVDAGIGPVCAGKL